MSEVEKATTETAPVESPNRGLVLMRNRSLWFGLVGTTVGGGVAGFSAALLFGVQAGFSQPLATFLAGAGALSAGVLAYLNGERTRNLTKQQHEADTKRERERHQADMDRERERHAEDSRRAEVTGLRDRYTAIAAQIADNNSAAIRQAGVYALTALADDWHAFGEDDERQVCINLLQWYLRVPFPEGEDPEKPDLSEREIRQTIVVILAERRRRPVEHSKSWAATAISMNQASLPNCVLQGNDLSDLSFSKADLTSANLNGADLTSANLNGAGLSGAYLIDANLNGAKLHGAKLSGAYLIEADLKGADLLYADLTSAYLGGTSLTDTRLNSANLIDADLTRANLNGANLNGADLSGADLTSANLNGAKLNRANLTDVNLTEITTDEGTQWPEGFTAPQPNPDRR